MKSTLDVVITPFIYFVIVIKLCYVVFSLLNIYFNVFKMDPDKIDFIKKWKERSYFVFTCSMAVLLVIVFNPWYNNERHMNSEVKLLFYLFGWITLVTADWTVFFKEAPWFQALSSSWK